MIEIILIAVVVCLVLGVILGIGFSDRWNWRILLAIGIIGFVLPFHVVLVILGFFAAIFYEFYVYDSSYEVVRFISFDKWLKFIYHPIFHKWQTIIAKSEDNNDDDADDDVIDERYEEE